MKKKLDQLFIHNINVKIKVHLLFIRSKQLIIEFLIELINSELLYSINIFIQNFKSCLPLLFPFVTRIDKQTVAVHNIFVRVY